MAVYDGFFDAVYNEETQTYDRDYSSGDIERYFAQAIGSGVSICDNPDSCKVSFANGQAAVAVGFLFIQGYWARIKDEAYTINIASTQTEPVAIIAHLNSSTRMIEIESTEVAESYPDSLCLAVVNPATGEVEDTRYNTDICGVIGTSSDLYEKVLYAQNYIDNEIDAKLDEVRQEVATQEATINAQIAAVNARVDSIAPPAVGTIKFSASSEIGEDWLKCDGSFVNEADYPELVAALGKLTPSGDKFKLISDNEIGPQISNGVLYGGRLWVYSFSTKKLYGVDVAGTAAIKEIAVTSESEYFNGFITPTPTSPIALSIVPHIGKAGAKLFLCQIIQDGGTSQIEDVEYSWTPYFQIFASEFSATESSLSMTIPFATIQKRMYNHSSYYYPYFNSRLCVPYVVSKIESGNEQYLCAFGSGAVTSAIGNGDYVGFFLWNDGDNEAKTDNFDYFDTTKYKKQRFAFSSKNKGEITLVESRSSSTSAYNVYKINSKPAGTFQMSSFQFAVYTSDNAQIPLNIGGASKVLASFSKTQFPWISYTQPAAGVSNPSLSLPNSSRVFTDGAAYLWGKDIFFIFVGTGIIFSRTLEEGDFGYLDTTSVLGTITQFGYLDYSQDEGTLYLLGQDTANKVKVAKIVLNTLYDYANDGAWLPLIASDGVPAYIKAVGDGGGDEPGETVNLQITVQEAQAGFDTNGYIIFNGERLTVGTFTRNVPAGGTFTVGFRKTSSGFTPPSTTKFGLKMNGSVILTALISDTQNSTRTESFNVSDYTTSGITLQGVYNV